MKENTSLRSSFEILEDLFTYHPPKNDEERKLHEIVNSASMTYAKQLASVVTNPAELTTILREIISF